MTKRIILGCYGIAGATILAINKTTYRPKDIVLDTYWEMLKIDKPYGKITTGICFGLAPAIVPVFAISIPCILITNNIISYHKENHD